MAREIRIQIVVSPNLLKGIGAAGLLAALSLPLMPETLTMTTYYPAPVGIYNKMTTTGNTLLARDGGNVGMGTRAPDTKAILDMTSTTQGFLPPRMTSAQRDAIPAGPADAGLSIYNATNKRPEFWDGAVWRPMGGVASQAVTAQPADWPGYQPYGSAETPYTYTNTSGGYRLIVTQPTIQPSGIYANGQRVGWCSTTVPYGTQPCNMVAIIPPNATYSVQNSGGSSFLAFTYVDF